MFEIFKTQYLNFFLHEKCAPLRLAGRLRKSMAFSMKTPLEPVSSKLAYLKTSKETFAIISPKGLMAVISFSITLILTSCNSVPPGKPPQGPIVTPEIKTSVFDRKSAVDFMVTSIATRCTPISSAGINLPHVVNEFTVSTGAVNNMSIELWQSLIRMKMIVPVEENDSRKQYRLLSEIREIAATDEKKDYLWELKLVSLNDNMEIWKDSVEFIVVNETPSPPSE